MSSSVEPLSGNMEEMASKILSEGNFFDLSLLRPVAHNNKAQSLLLKNQLYNKMRDSKTHAASNKTLIFHLLSALKGM